MPKRIFAGRLDNLSKICDFVSQAAQEAGFDASGIYAVQLAVDEAVTNIIEHAYGGENIGDIECNYQIMKDGLKITLVDNGKPFNPDTIPEPMLNAPLDEITPRGLGVFFMRNFMDEVQFEFTKDHGNILTMIKRKQSDYQPEK